MYGITGVTVAKGFASAFDVLSKGYTAYNITRTVVDIATEGDYRYNQAKEDYLAAKAAYEARSGQKVPKI